MIRILLPLGMIAAIFFGPMFSETSTGSATGDRVAVVTGDYFVGNTINCMIGLKVPLGDECASEGKINDSGSVGSALSYTVILAAVASALGVIGLLPFVGRVTSIVTMIAGLVGLGSLGLFGLTMMGTDAGLPGIQWGTYAAAGLALLTTISGLGGMRGR